MNPAARQGSLDAIANDRRVKVILISTKSGNSGAPYLGLYHLHLLTSRRVESDVL
jgi:hypothetical protein